MNPDDLARAYAEHGYALFRRCLVYLGDEASAQQAVRDAFVRALRSGEAAQGEAYTRASLCRAVDKLCMERLEDRRSAADAPASAVSAEVYAAAILDDDLESFLALRRLLAGLDPATQQLAVLYYLDEYTQEEIATELGLSRRAVDKRVEALERHAHERLMRESTA